MSHGKKRSLRRRNRVSVRSREKGQAAMEFLMTYGWAILAAIIAIGALTAYGVFSPGKYFSSDQVVVGPPFYGNGAAAENAEGSQGEMSFEFLNNGGEDYIITGVDATECGSVSSSVVMAAGSSKVFTIPCDSNPLFAGFAVGSIVKGEMNIRYKKQGSELALTALGSYVVRIRKGISPILNVLFGGQTPANGATLPPGTPLTLEFSTYSQTNLDRYAFVDIDNSLVGWWRMDGTVGNTVKDFSSYGNDGEALGMISQLTGQFGESLKSSSPLGDSITLKPYTTNPSLKVDNNITISAWIYLQNYKSTILSGDYGGAGLYQLTTDYVGAPLIKFQRSNQYGMIVDVTVITFDLKLLEWQHISVTMDQDSPDNVNFYLNGVNIGTKTGSNSFAEPSSSDQFPQIGTSYPSGSDFFIGEIDEVMLFNRALASQEIASIYDARNGYTNTFILTPGEHTYRACIVDSDGNLKCTSTRTVTVT